MKVAMSTALGKGNDECTYDAKTRVSKVAQKANRSESRMFACFWRKDEMARNRNVEGFVQLPPRVPRGARRCSTAVSYCSSDELALSLARGLQSGGPAIVDIVELLLYHQKQIESLHK